MLTGAVWLLTGDVPLLTGAALPAGLVLTGAGGAAYRDVLQRIGLDEPRLSSDLAGIKGGRLPTGVAATAYSHLAAQRVCAAPSDGAAARSGEAARGGTAGDADRRDAQVHGARRGRRAPRDRRHTSDGRAK